MKQAQVRLHFILGVNNSFNSAFIFQNNQSMQQI